MLKLIRSDRKYYSKIILYFLLFTVILVSLLSILLYINYQNYSLKLINRSNLRVLKQISGNMGKINEHSGIYINSIFGNPATTSLMYNADPGVVEHLNKIKALESLLVAHPYVHSIYIYNAEDDIYHVIGDQTLIRKGRIYDSEIDDLIHNDIYRNPIPRTIPYSERKKEKKINVYTYIMRGIRAYNSNKNFAVVVNIKSTAFFSKGITEENLYDIPGKIYSINTQGVITGTAEQDLFLNDVSEKPYIKKIINGRKEDYFITDDLNNKKLLTYIKVPVSDWILVNEVPYNYVISMLDKVKIVTAIIIFINLIIGSIIAFFLSRRLYSPIDRLKQLMGQRKNNLDTQFKKNNELDMLVSYFHEMENNMNRLQSLNRDTRQFIKNGLLESILKDSIIKPAEIKELFEQCNIKLSLEDPAVIIILKIDDYQKNYLERFTGDFQSLYKFALNNITLEVLGERYRTCESIDPGEDYTVTIISLKENEREYSKIVKNMEGYIQQIQEYYNDFIGVSVSGFISSAADNLYEVEEIYDEVLELSKERFIYGHGCIINSEQYGTTIRQSNLIDEEMIDDFKESLKLSKYEEVTDIYYHIMNDIKSTNYDNILFVANYLSSIVISIVLLIERNKNVQLNIDFMEFKESILKCETLDEMHQIFEEMFRKLTKDMDYMSNNKSDNIVDRVNDYIENNYMFETLCSAEIAEYVDLSRRYLNRVYRQNASRSISDYIKEVRLKKAAKLLIETDDVIEIILEQIGWTTKEYFYLCFKKEFGVTPGEYRAKHHKG